MAMPKVRADRADHLLKFLYIIFGSRHYYSCIHFPIIDSVQCNIE